MTSPLTLEPTDVALSDRVTLLAGEAKGKYPDGNTVLVAGSEGVILIDPSLTVHRRGGGPCAVDRILVSHAHEDHMSGISAVIRGSNTNGSVSGELADGTTIHAHDDDLHCVRDISELLKSYDMGERETDEWGATLVADFHLDGWPQAEGFAEGDVFDLGDVSVTVMHLPGHTRGHSAFLIEPEGIAFVGDVDLSSFGPYYGDHWSELDDFVASIARVRELDMHQYVTFHHKGVIHGRVEFIRQLDAFASVIDRRDERLLTLLETPRTLGELAAAGIIYRPGALPQGWGISVERRSIDMHLARLIRNGLAIEHEGRFSTT